ncbi:hypothetical protein M0802_013116 [Mischocyttarus mexicanus]|nr:hypothetical protein M0802_013116 [Mischocyttarus mexicanus]
MITLTSGLEEKEKDKLEQIMKQIDGIILTNWQNYCTHLTVLSPKLTEKVAVALAAGIMIVTVDYWKAVKYAMENDHHPIPKINNFVPRIKEEYIPKGLVSLYANDKRKKLFRKKIFFFYELKQYETYRLMIKLAGGDSNFIDLKCKQNFSIGDNIIHIKINKDDEDSAVSKTFKRNHDYISKLILIVFFTLQRYKKRFIPDSEIPLAILFCSIEKYCNQKYHFSNVFKNEKQFDYFLPETLVMDTQDLELETEEVPSSMYKIQKDKVKKLSKFFDNNDISNEKSPSEKSNDEMHQIAISDNEEIPNSPVQPTTSLSSFSPKRIELEESNSKNVFVDNIEIDEIKLNEEQGTSTKNKSQSLEKQQETTIPLESSPSETRNNLQNENTAENPSTSETSIYKRSVGKTFQKAHVKIPEKRIRL